MSAAWSKTVAAATTRPAGWSRRSDRSYGGPLSNDNAQRPESVAAGIVVLMEGRLRRVSKRTWEGELHGYRVFIGERGGQWYVWLCPCGEWAFLSEWLVAAVEPAAHPWG